MDELLYLLALIAGIGGSYFIWWNAKTKKQMAAPKRKNEKK